MSFRELADRRVARAAQEQRSRAREAATILAILVILIATAAFAIWRGAFKSDSRPPSDPNRLMMTFGFNREPITRNFAIDITPRSSSPTTGTQPAGTQAITVRLASDLRREDTVGEFPAEQITVGINQLTSTRVNLNITADPWTPEKVEAGTYMGNLELRGPGVTYSVPLTIWLRSRENKWAFFALLLLLLGSLLGLVVKWITERLTPQAALVRRLASLKESIGYRDDTRTVPVSVRLDFERLEDQISREDYAAAETSFKKLEEKTERLALLTSQFQLLIDQLSSQAESINRASLLSEHDTILLEGVLDAEYMWVQDLLACKWEDDTSYQELSGEIKQARNAFGIVRVAIQDFIDTHDEDLREFLSWLQPGNIRNAEERYSQVENGRQQRKAQERQPRPERGAQATQTTHKGKARVRPKTRDTSRTARRSTVRSARPDGQPLKFVFRQARVLAGAASVIVVRLVGLKLEYLDNQQFDGALSAWLALALWGAVVELSGVSILDVVGRLGSSGAAPPGAARA